MIKFVKCKLTTNSAYLKPGVVYTATDEKYSCYSIKEFGGRTWHIDCFTVVSSPCPCEIKNCIKHRNKQC